MRQFTTAARKGTSTVANPVDIEFEYEVSEGEFVTMTAHPPTTGQLALFAAHQNDGGIGSIRSLFELLECSLEPQHFKVIEGQLRTGMDLGVVTELVQYLTGEWSARPTTSPNGSLPSPSTTGRRSTVKQRAGASTT